jgi:hypothetical protein
MSERDDMSKWRPIETAPKDGTEFLAYDTLTQKMDVAVWVDLFGGQVKAVQEDRENGPLSDEFGYEPRAIRHWKPLPPPPPQ